jgi:hypothetical protein
MRETELRDREIRWKRHRQIDRGRESGREAHGER